MTTFGADPNFQKKLAAMLLQQGTDTSPVQHWTQGAARLAQALVGGNIMRAEREADQQNAEKIGQFLMAGQGGAPAAAASPSITSEPLPTPSMSPPASSRVYSENEFNPIDAAVATPKELAVGVPAPAQYAPTIGKAAVDNDIPPQLLAAQLKQESGFNPNAVSPAGAQGISQFMPGTAAEMGINPLDPNQAIPAGARYLRQNIDKFGGSIPHGLAAYNGGPGRLERAGGDISRMPAETRQYVQNVQQMAGGDPAALPPNAAPTQGQGMPTLAPETPSNMPVVAPQTPTAPMPNPGAVSPRAIGNAILRPQEPAGGPNRLAIAAQLLSDPRTPPQMRALIMDQVGPKAPIKLAEGETLYDPRTLKPLTTAAPKQTDELREYGFYKQQGGTKSFFEYKADLKKAGAQNISIDQKPEVAFDTEAGKLQAQRFNDLAADGQTAKQLVADVQVLSDLGKSIGTGKGAEIKASLGPYAEAAGIKIDGLSEIQAYEAVVNRLAPNLRVKGSGSQSDVELRNFLKSLPSLGNTPEGNAIASEVLTGLAENKVRAAEIGSRALNKEITRVEAEKQLRELPDPLANYRAYMKASRAAPTSGAKPTSTEGQTAVNPKTGERLMLKDGKWVPFS